MPAGLNFGFGLQRVFDANQRFMRGGFPFWLRMKNFADTQQQTWSQLGFTIAPSAGPNGTTNTPVNLTFTAQGAGTNHSITIAANTYIYTEIVGDTSTTVATAMATIAVTGLGVLIVNDPYITPTSALNVVTLTPAVATGVVVQISATDGNSTSFLWVTNNPAATPTATVGYTDIPIYPPPTSSMVSMHNIGMSEGKLRFGARNIRISQAFVTAQVQAQNLSNQNQVWIGPQVLGLVSENLLMDIVYYNHYEIAGVTVYWDLVCNANEIR